MFKALIIKILEIIGRLFGRLFQFKNSADQGGINMAKVTVTNNRYTTESLYQWDKNQVLEITGLSLPSVPEIHFTNDSMDRAIVRQASMSTAGVVTAYVPNALLQKPYKIKAYICLYSGDSFKSEYLIEIPVVARAKPDDYSFEDDAGEIYSFNALENYVNETVRSLTADWAAYVSECETAVSDCNQAIEDCRSVADQAVADCESVANQVRENCKSTTNDAITECQAYTDNAIRTHNHDGVEVVSLTIADVSELDTYLTTVFQSMASYSRKQFALECSGDVSGDDVPIKNAFVLATIYRGAEISGRTGGFVVFDTATFNGMFEKYAKAWNPLTNGWSTFTQIC